MLHRRNRAERSISRSGEAACTETSGVLLALARAAEDAGYYGDSVVAFDEYLALRPADDAARRDRARVCGLTATGREEGLKQLVHYVEKHPSDPVGYYDLAQLTWTDSLKQPSTALEGFASRSAVSAAYFGRGWLLYRLGRVSDALPDFQAAAKFQPDDPVDVESTRACLPCAEPGVQSEQTFRRVLQSAPQDADALMHLARALIAQDRAEEAQPYLEQFRKRRPEKERNPRSEPGMLELATLPHSELAARQITRLREEAASHPGDPELQFHLAGLLLAEGQTDAALAAYQELLTRNADPRLWYSAGTALARAGQYAIAQEFLRRAGDFPGARLDYAIATFFGEGPQQASEAMKEVSESERSGDYYLMVRIAEAKGRTAEAQQFQEGLRRSPERADVADRVASFLLKQNRPDDALRVIAGAAKKNPNNPDLLLRQAVILTAADRMTDAQQIIRSIELRWPEWARAYVADGLVLRARGEDQ